MSASDLSPPFVREIRLVQLATHEALRAAHDRDATEEGGRRLTIVRVRDADGNEGWGECSALNAPTYSPEWADDAFEVLSGTDSPSLAVHPMAAAAVAMAQLDLELRRDRRSLVEPMLEWAGGGTAHERLAIGGVVGLPKAELGTDEAVAETAATAVARAESGARRLKLKVAPDHLDAVVRAVAEALAALGTVVELQLDANGSLGLDDLETLVTLGDLVTAVEEPFADLDLVVELARRSPTTILLDESAASAAEARDLLDAGVLRASDPDGAGVGLALKPARLGGLPLAVDLLRWCSEHALPASAGGMLESGLGRHALAVFASLPGMSIAGDVSPARQWLAVDPWPDLETADGEIVVPTGHGVAPPPDLDILDEVTVRSTEWLS